MEIYTELPLDERWLALLTGAGFLAFSLLMYRSKACHGFLLGSALMVLIGLTQYVPRWTALANLPMIVVVLPLTLGVSYDLIRRRRLGQDKGTWVSTACCVALMWSILAMMEWGDARHQVRITIESDLVAVYRGSESLTYPRGKFRLLQIGGGHWELKNGTDKVTLWGEEEFRCGNDVVKAADLVSRLEEWSGKRREIIQTASR